MKWTLVDEGIRCCATAQVVPRVGPGDERDLRDADLRDAIQDHAVSRLENGWSFKAKDHLGCFTTGSEALEKLETQRAVVQFSTAFLAAIGRAN